MSAFVVSTEHIDALIAAGHPGRSAYPGSVRWHWEGESHQLTLTNPDEVGTMLLSENVRSVEFRYSPPGREAIYGEGFESGKLFELPGTYREESPAPGIAPVSFPEWWTPYQFNRRTHALPHVDSLKLIDCFEYQTCEHEEWEASEAFAYCAALRRYIIACLPGYEDAKWSL